MNTVSTSETRHKNALQEILAKHADDNHRPKAFYIASKALNHPEPTDRIYVEALQEVLRTHANDDIRPKAFYIADHALPE